MKIQAEGPEVEFTCFPSIIVSLFQFIHKGFLGRNDVFGCCGFLVSLKVDPDFFLPSAWASYKQEENSVLVDAPERASPPETAQ